MTNEEIQAIEDSINELDAEIQRSGNQGYGWWPDVSKRLLEALRSETKALERAAALCATNGCLYKFGIIPDWCRDCENVHNSRIRQACYIRYFREVKPAWTINIDKGGPT